MEGTTGNLFSTVLARVSLDSGSDSIPGSTADSVSCSSSYGFLDPFPAGDTRRKRIGEERRLALEGPRASGWPLGRAEDGLATSRSAEGRKVYRRRRRPVIEQLRQTASDVSTHHWST